MCSAQCGKSSLLIKMKAPRLLTLLCHLTLSLGALNAQHWQVRDLLEKNRGELQVTGNPLVRDDGCRTAVFFDGKGDGIFMDAMPLTGLQQFTIEVVFKPLRGGNFEQRFFHCGEIGGDRVAFVVNQGELSTYVNGKKRTCNNNSLHSHPDWQVIAGRQTESPLLVQGCHRTGAHHIQSAQCRRAPSNRNHTHPVTPFRSC